MPEATTFPFETLLVKRTEALAKQQALMNARRGYPVILDAVDEDVELLEEGFEDYEEDTQDLLTKSQTIDAEQWLNQNFEEEFDKDNGIPREEWPEEVEPSTELYFARFDEDIADDELQIVLIPTEHAWQIPCYLKLGNWNSCPPAEAQSAVLRYWEERYGAKLLVVGPDTLELSVEHPPTTHEEALELAVQQYFFCTDIVDQGVETIEALAATLLNGKAWFFWWD